jgi:hypothetical protein
VAVVEWPRLGAVLFQHQDSCSGESTGGVGVQIHPIPVARMDLRYEMSVSAAKVEDRARRPGIMC